MLQVIRKAADSIPFRVVLFFIVLAFAVWGLKDNVNTIGSSAIVTFKSAKPIDIEEFNYHKSQELSRIQRISGTALSEEEIKQYGINQIVLDRLVTNRLLDKAVREYNLDFNDQVIASFIRQMPAFHNSKNEFDLEMFKSAVHRSGMTEEEYSNDIKQRLTQNVFINSFISSYNVPHTLVNNIVNFMSEERVVDLAYITINDSKIAAITDPTENQLEEFYKANTELFVTPEKRTIDYTIISNDAVKKYVKVTKEDISAFYKENQDEFANMPLSKAESQIKDFLTKQATESLMIDLAKNLEDEVAGGSTLQEIGEKFVLKVNNVTDSTIEHLMQHKVLSNISDTVFTMGQGEVSYPLELSPQNMVIVEIKQITPSVAQEISKIRPMLVKKWKENACLNHYMKVMQDFVSSSNQSDFVTKAQGLGLSIKNNQILKRSKLSEDTSLAPEMLLEIFDTKLSKDTGHVIPKAYQQNNTIWAVKIDKAYNDKTTSQDIMKSSQDNIINKIREGIFIDIIEHLKSQENVMINQNDQALSK